MEKQVINTPSTPPLGGWGAIITSLVINGNISKLSAQQRVHYYKQLCDKLGLDPLSQPFRILRLHGKEILYCDRGGAQQLNKLHKVSHEIKARETVSDCYLVSALASTPDGRHTESIGAVPIAHLKGEDLCNAMMKAETKAKRRATLDLLGLGILDESEVESLQQAASKSNSKSQIPKGNCELPTENYELPTAHCQPDKGLPDSFFLSLKGLERRVHQCKDESELFLLYNDNKDRIESAPELKRLLTQRKNELRKANRTAA